MSVKSMVCKQSASGFILISKVEALARVLLPEIQAFFESEEGQREFAEWKAKQEKDKAKQN